MVLNRSESKKKVLKRAATKVASNFERCKVVKPAVKSNTTTQQNLCGSEGHQKGEGTGAEAFSGL